ncbi:MAG TPA: cobyric acid synthase [Actinomycetes bacterium]|nr:cobyric acid synthase [Actinomycetes bacterium]
MVQGVSSDAGKSLIATALCRWLRRRGALVAPFKAQNMSNNARVVDGGEIGTAQWLQALAAGVAADVRMNPVLLKPEADTRSQVVVNGVVSRELTQSPWRGRSTRLWPHVQAAYRSLAADYDVVVVEGAGSPAETNLWADDIVNMRVAELAGAPVLLVADIDRGGAFAHLYGTWALLPPPWRSRICGFLLNKFRGDEGLLAPAPAELERATGVPTVGVVPWIEHALPDEEGPTLGTPRGRSRRVCIVGGPYASNLDEFVRLQQVADVRWARTPDALAGTDLVVLPGSKHVANDLAWMRSGGMADAVISAAASGLPVLGICGGLQMLGGTIDDPAGVEGSAEGLDLLPVVTSYLPGKTTKRTAVRFGRLPPTWSWLDSRSFDGYEIHHGTATVSGSVEAIVGDGLGYADGNLLGIYAHGLFESDEVLDAYTGIVPPPLDATFEQLADLIDAHLDIAWLARCLDLPALLERSTRAARPPRGCSESDGPVSGYGL